MQTIKILKDTEGYKAGQVVPVEKNTAHRLIDRGLAKLATSTEYNDRMVGGKGKRMDFKTK